VARQARTISFDGHPKALRVFDALPRGERSAWVCAAIEAAAGRREVSLADVWAKLLEVEALIKSGVGFSGDNAQVEGSVPPVPEDVAARLGRLGL